MSDGLQVSVLREHLAPALARVVQGADLKGTIPLTKYICLRAGAGSMYLMCTDLDNFVLEQVACTTASCGTCCVPVRGLRAFLQNLPKSAPDRIAVVAHPKTNHVILTCGGFSTRLDAFPEEEFPPWPGLLPQEVAHVTAPGIELARAIDSTLYAVSTDHTRPVLTGLLFEFAPSGVCTVVGADGHRLARATLAVQTAQAVSGLVPGGAVKLIRSLMASCDAVNICFYQPTVEEREADDRAWAWWWSGRTEVMTSLLDGKFPDYRAVRCPDFTGRVVGERAKLIEAVKYLAALRESSSPRPGRSKSRYVTDAAVCSVSDGQLSLVVKDTTVAAQVTVEVSGQAPTFAVQAPLLLESLQHIDSPQVELATGTAGGGEAIYLSGGGAEHIVMQVSFPKWAEEQRNAG